jgi:hypothetical protein
MRLHWVGITAALAGLAVGLGAWGCQEEAWSPTERSHGGPDYTNFAPPPIEMPEYGSPGQPAPSAVPASAEAVVRAAVAFRMYAAADLGNAVRECRTGPCLDFLTKSDSFQAAPAAWAYFFSTTVMVLGNQATAEPVVGYYSPFLDAVVLTRWRTDDGGRPMMVGGSLRSGHELESRQPAAPPALPRWLSADGPAQASLAQQHRGFLAAFSRQFPPSPATAWESYAAPSPMTLQATGALAVTQALTMCALADGPNKEFCAALKALRLAVGRGDAGELTRMVPLGNPLSVSEIAGLPAPFRGLMSPVFAVWDEHQAMIFMADSRTLRFCSMAAYDLDKTVRLKAFGLMDLMADMPADGKRIAMP